MIIKIVSLFKYTKKHDYEIVFLLVGITRLELVRCYHQRIFLLLYVAIANQSIVVVWTMSSPYVEHLGGWYIVSTHL